MSTGAEQALDALSRGALRSDPERAWQLFDAAWPLLEGRLSVYLRSLRLPRELREDCGQNTLLRVWKARATYRGHSLDEFFAWIYRITRHEVLRLADPPARKLVLESDLSESSSVEDLAEVGDPKAVSRESELQEELRALEQCLDGLDQRSRSLVELLYGPHASTERAAALMLEISKSYVNSLRREALESLARCLQRKGVES